MAYYWGPSRNAAATMRFLMPTFSLYILAGLWMGRELLRRKDVPQAGRIALLGLLIAVQLIWGSPQFFAHAVRLRFQKRTLAQATTAIDRIAQPGDVVVTTGLLLQQLDFVRLWKVVDGNVYLIGMPGGRGGMRGFGGGMAGADGRPSPGQAAKAEAQRELYGGDEAQREQKFMFDIKKWAGDKGVWLVGAESDVMSFAGDGARVTIVRRVTLAASPTPIGPRGLFGPGGFPGGPGGFGGGPPGRGGSMGMPPQEMVIARWELQ